MSSPGELVAGAGALALVLARPLGLVALVLPVVLLAASLRRARPEPRVTGTLALWEAGPGARGRRTRRVPPPAVWCAAAALLLGILALVGPRAASEARRTWTVVLDASPSMGLPAPAGGGTRAAVGVARAAELVAGLASAGDRVRWLSARAGERMLAPGEVPDADWSRPGERVTDAPPLAAFDAPGVVVVSDVGDATLESLRRAGAVVTGAEPVPGPIGAEGSDLLVWNGQAVERRAGALAPRRVILRRGEGAPAVPVLERVLRAWAEGRGLRLAEARGEQGDGGAQRSDTSDTSSVALVLSLEGDPGRARDVRVERDGWSAPGRAGGALAAPTGAASERWLTGLLADGTQATVVDARPGRVRTTLTALEEPAGDPAAFAVSWAGFLDRWSRAPAGCVSLGERRAAAAPFVRAPRAPARDGEARDEAKAVDAWLTLGAVLAAGLAMVLAQRGAQSSPTAIRP